MKKHIVKKAGHNEPYDSQKIFYSIYAACLNASLEDKAAQKTGKQVAKEMNKWIKGRKEVSTGDIFKQVTRLLVKEDKNAAFMYATHRDIF